MSRKNVVYTVPYTSMQGSDIKVPLSVMDEYKETYRQNLRDVTQGTGRLMLFAGDQKVEHLNDDFHGEGIAHEDGNPEHMFEIASKARIGAFATQIGMIARYGMDYPKIPYIVKFNSKSNVVKTAQKDPLSTGWLNHSDVLDFKKKSGLNIVGVGYTIYLGSEFENDMLTEAARLVYASQSYGLITVLWIYPRGKAVLDEKDPHIIAGAAGVGATLGADFVKVNAPKKEGVSSAEALKEAVSAAGRTKVICAGGSSMDTEKFLQTLHDQIHIAGTAGNATGRNIHQRDLNDAVHFANAVAAITFDDASVSEAMQIYSE